jgi:hypothetical protein
VLKNKASGEQIVISFGRKLPSFIPLFISLIPTNLGLS